MNIVPSGSFLVAPPSAKRQSDVQLLVALHFTRYMFPPLPERCLQSNKEQRRK